MKQSAPAFSFKKNTDIAALPDARPEPLAPVVAKLEPKGKAGRKPESADGARKIQIAGYLTDAEMEQFKIKLDGRPVSAVVRNLILDYINHG